MKVVVIDVETTSLERTLEDGVVHIGATEIDTDLMDTTGDSYQNVCKPVFDRTLIEDAWIFEHGELTIDQVMEGPFHSVVAAEFEKWLNGRQWTAYNLAFEEKFLCDNPWNLPRSNLECIMLAATPVCRIPGYDGDTYKWPKLKEAWRVLIGEPYPSVWHSALQDASAAAMILLKLIESGDYQIPS